MLRCGPPDTASAPGGTSRRTTVPAPVPAPSPTLDRGDEGVVGRRSGRAGRWWCGASRRRRSWRRSSRRRCWCPRRSRRRRRRRGAAPWRRRRSRRSWSRRSRRSCRRRRAGCRGGGRRTGRRWRSAPITASSPWVRTTRAPAPISQSLRVVSGPITASSPTTVAPSSWVPGRMRDVLGASTTSASTQVVAGSMTVTPSRIQRVRIRRFSSRPSSASWTRSLAPSVCITSSIDVRADGEAGVAGDLHGVGQVVLALGVVVGDLRQRLGQELGVEREDPGVDLADLALLGAWRPSPRRSPRRRPRRCGRPGRSRTGSPRRRTGC